MSRRNAWLNFLFILPVFFIFNSFRSEKSTEPPDSGKILFERHCSSCHMLPDPASLTKSIWASNVLPTMAARMGIIYPNFDPLRGLSKEEKEVVDKNQIIPSEPQLNEEDWNKLADYVISQAPDSVQEDMTRLNRNSELRQFLRQDVALDTEHPSMITGIKFDSLSHSIYIGTVYNQILNWGWGKGLIRTRDVSSPPVDFNFYKKQVYLTEIGKLFPTELSTGSYARLDSSADFKILDLLHRPVHTEIEDLNGDGIPELVVCNFGNKTGSLSLFKKDRADKPYKETVLLPLPGAIKCYLKDMDGDGKKDIVALFAQGDESVWIFYQKENLKFKGKRVLRFPPNYGTTDMVMVDYNHDGLTDIITVHGDNADYSNILKAYHGIRINLNQGNDVFQEKFFYPIYGVTKVIAADFDQDGDIDLATTSFFPDFGPLIDESFVYLENINPAKFEFKPYVLKSGIPVKSLTMEVADIDGDGDMDLILGNFSRTPGPVPPSLDLQWKTAKYGLILFINQLHKAPKAD